ncbi:MAG: uroporphyrinogen-III synthase, partial [Acidimicrobiales bacterium]
MTRERGHNDALRALVPEGSDVVEVPLTETRYYDLAEVAASMNAWRDVRFSTLVVTSARSAPYLEVVAPRLAPDAQVFSVGAASSRALVARGFTPSAEAEDGAAQLAPLITRGPVLLLGAKVMRGELGEALDKSALRIEHLACYETVPVTPDDAGAHALRSAQVVFVGAPSAWRTAQEFIAPSTWVVVPGATTAGEVRARHERVIEGWGPELRATL